MAPVKPIHPAAVHFPLAFLTLAYALDIAPRLPLPATAASYLPPNPSHASYLLLSLGLITAVPAIMTGVQQAVLLIGKQGMYETDSTGYSITMRTKVKALIAHAVISDIVIGLSALVWYKKRAAAKATLAGKVGLEGTVLAGNAYEAELWMVVLQGFLFAGLMMAANIGGSLTYVFGVGFAAGGASKKKA